jgi:hypothetical protein
MSNALTTAEIYEIRIMLPARGWAYKQVNRMADEVERLRAEVAEADRAAFTIIERLRAENAKMADELKRLRALSDRSLFIVDEQQAKLNKAVAALEETHAFIASLDCNDYSVDLENERGNLEIALDETLKEIRGE